MVNANNLPQLDMDPGIAVLVKDADVISIPVIIAEMVEALIPMLP